MSLINDALKRASQSDKNRPAQAPLPLPMQPAAPMPRNSDTAGILIAVAFVAMLVLAVSGWFYFSLRNNTPLITETTPAAPIRKAIAEPATPTPRPAPVVQKTLPPLAAPARTPVVAAAPVHAPSPRVVLPETFPTNLTVKAIFYSKSNPRALVNGQTVETGDKIGDVLVTGIMSDRIFLDWKGQSKVLMMGGQ